MADPRIKVDWTDSLRAQVVKAWENGSSATEIAAGIPGATRSGILGVVHRAGKKRSDANVCRAASAKAAKPKAPPKARPKPEPKPEPARLPAKGWHNSGVPIPGHIPPQPPAPEPLRVTLMELDGRSCRWPVTDRAPWLYCGHGIVGENSVSTPYCAHHARAALPKDNPKKPRTVKQLERSVRHYL